MLKQHIQRFDFHVDPVVNTCTQCQPDEQGDLLRACSWDDNLEILIQPWRAKFVKTESSYLCGNTVLERFQARGTKMTATDAYEQAFMRTHHLWSQVNSRNAKVVHSSSPFVITRYIFPISGPHSERTAPRPAGCFPKCAFLNFCKAPPINKRQSPDWDKVCRKYSKIFTSKYFLA